MMAEVCVGLGSNARPVHHLQFACRELAALLTSLRCSEVYAGAALDGATGRYLNMVVAGGSDLSAAALQAALRAIERRAGRRRGGTEVTLDLDLLLYDDVVDAQLRLPREDVLTRAFVLRPLAELAPRLRHPLTGRRLDEHWAEFAKTQPQAALEPLGALPALAAEPASG
jgi:2-amino-4-hydroxy-6-hydroxymethyldihydropteridine diphosphokinase